MALPRALRSRIRVLTALALAAAACSSESSAPTPNDANAQTDAQGGSGAESGDGGVAGSTRGGAGGASAAGVGGSEGGSAGLAGSSGASGGAGPTSCTVTPDGCDGPSDQLCCPLEAFLLDEAKMCKKPAGGTTDVLLCASQGPVGATCSGESIVSCVARASADGSVEVYLLPSDWPDHAELLAETGLMGCTQDQADLVSTAVGWPTCGQSSAGGAAGAGGAG